MAPRNLFSTFRIISRFLPILVLPLLVPSLSIARAQQQQTLAQRSSVKRIDTPIAAIKWRITDGDFVERSLDSGATWHGQEVAARDSLLAGSAPNSTICWVVGRNGLAFLTRDAKTWKKLRPPVAGDLVAVSAENGSSAVVTTADGRRFATHDGGKKWKELKASAHSKTP
jgi:photosystem II stability/assembly factor-like uncharacterized protein